MVQVVQELSFEEIKKHNDRNSTWLVINNDVYDVTEFLNEVSQVLWMFATVSFQSRICHLNKDPYLYIIPECFYVYYLIFLQYWK